MRRFATLLALLSTAAAFGADTYIALGDSIAFGYQPTPVPPIGNAFSFADRYYVKAVADKIATLHGSRPTVRNLALPAETSSSFFDTTNIYRAANLNYWTDPTWPNPLTAPTNGLSQFDFAKQAVAAAKATGTVRYLSLSLGANDLLQATDPLTIPAVLAGIATNYATALTYFRAELPTTTFLLPGFYNPYPVGSSLHTNSAPVIAQLNTIIQGQAALFGGKYIDFYTPIEGNQLTHTFIGTSYADIHPTDLGYAALSGAAVAAVPEPASMVALGLGAAALLRRRRK